MGASNFNELLIKMAMDTSQAVKDLEAFARKAAATTSTAAADKASTAAAQKKEALEKASTAHAEKHRTFAEAAKKTWADIGGAYTTINGGLEKANQLIRFMVASADAYGKAMTAAQGASTFGANTEMLEKMNQTLLGTVQNIDLARAAQEGLSVGLKGNELEDATKAAGILAQQLGIAKDESLKMVMGGKLTAQALQVAGVTQLEIQNAILETEIKQARTLTDQEKALIQIQMVTQALAKQQGGLDRNIAQATDELARARKELSQVTDELGKSFLPVITAVMKGVGGTVSWLGKFGEAIVDVFSPGRMKMLRESEQEKQQQTQEAKAAAFRKRMIEANRRGISTDDVAQEEKELEQARKQGEALGNAQVAGMIKAEGIAKAQREQARREWLQEQQAFQNEVKAKSRNFFVELTNAYSTQLPLLSSILGGVAQYSDMLRKSAAYGTEKYQTLVLEKANELAEVRTRTLRSEGDATTQLQNQLILNQDLAANAAYQLSVKQVIREQDQLREGIAKMEELRRRTEKEEVKDLLDLNIEFTRELIRQRDLRKMAMAELERRRHTEYEVGQQMLEFERQKLEIQGRMTEQDTNAKLAQVQNALAQAVGGFQKSPAALKQMEQDRASLEMEARRLEIKQATYKLEQDMVSGKVSEAQLAIDNQKILNQEKQLEGMGKLYDANQKLIQGMIKGKDAGAVLVDGVEAALKGVTQAAGGALTDAFTKMFEGKGIEQALGGMVLAIAGAMGDALIATGTVTLLQGISSIFTYGTTGNPAGIAVGGIMLAAGALMKAGSIVGAAALANSASETPASTSVGKSPTGEPQSPVSPIGRSGATTYQVFMTDPYFEGNHEQHAASTIRYLQRYGSRSGLPVFGGA